MLFKVWIKTGRSECLRMVGKGLTKEGKGTKTEGCHSVDAGVCFLPI